MSGPDRTDRTDPAVVLSVTSPDQVAATWAELHGLAARWDTGAARAAWLAAADAVDAAHPALAATTPLSPATGLAAGTAIALCAGGPGGLAVCASGLLADAERVRWFAAVLVAVDDEVEQGLVRLGGLAAGGWGDDGRGVAVPRPDLAVPAEAARPATSLADLLRGLDAVTALAAVAPGTVAVRSTGPPGDRRHVLLLPGTDDMVVVPGDQDADVRDLTTNLRLLGGLPTAYEEGVRAALGSAGVRPGEPVLVVGHSQGGMAALALTDRVGGAPVAVAGVLTAGSPLAHAGPGGPGAPPLLALEHAPDVVPLLDGVDDAAPGRDGAPQGPGTTVRFDLPGDPGLVEAHDLATYVAGAEAAERDGGRAVSAYVDRLRADGFLTRPGEPPPTATTVLVQVVRRR